MSAPLDAIFQAKYNEFAAALLDVFPELSDVIKASLEMTPDMRVMLYKQLVLPTAGNPKRDQAAFPGMVLPGVFINEGTWNSASDGTKKAINQFLSIMTFSFVMKDGNSAEFSEDAFRKFADKFMDEWRSKMDRADFNSFSSRFQELFGSGGNRLPPFPEKFKNGRLAKLAEDIVREIKPEDFGLDPETIKLCEQDPSKAFELIMQMAMRNPNSIQTAMKKIVKKLQDKFQRGEFRPEDLAAEAEEMMKEFSENPAFVEMMESMRKAFSFEDPESAKAAGQEQSARLAIVRNRLRQKQAQKEASRNANTLVTPTLVAPVVASAASAPISDADLEVEFASISVKSNKKKGKK